MKFLDLQAIKSFLQACNPLKALSEIPSESVSSNRLQFPNLDIEVDGGVSPATIDACAKVMEVETFSQREAAEAGS
jgi:pentose-5-phosphate-3-epimerase